MVVSHLGLLKPFSTIGREEATNVEKALTGGPLSGYLGGIRGGGYWIERLASEWQDTFKVNHAIPCNSATSGLLAACMAIGIGPGSTVWTTAYSMSATAACAKVLGANIVFIDIEPMRFSMNMNNFTGTTPTCIIVTNLFGHPAYLAAMRSWCDSNKVILIEDNAQSPFAMENGHYAGTIGHIGVFSLNVHKHIQCGEGGVVVTNDEALAGRLHNSINHGELGTNSTVGLNLRMTEPTAAIACAQLKKGPRIVADRRELALELTDMVSGIDWIWAPVEAVGCHHVFYMWAAEIANGTRHGFVKMLLHYGFPMRAGYSPLLTRVFNSNTRCPTAELLEDRNLISYEVCAYDPTSRQREQMREIIAYAAESGQKVA